MEKEEIKTTPPPSPPYYYEEDEIDLLELWGVIWKRRRMIVTLVFLATILSIVISIYMPNIYRSSAVILPAKSGKMPSLGIGLLGPISEMIPIPTSSSSSEIISRLKSRELYERLIQKYNLLPVLFYKIWDPEKKTWIKKGFSIKSIVFYPMKIMSKLANRGKPGFGNSTEEGIPTIDDGIRKLRKMVNVQQDRKLGTITVSVDFEDPVIATKILSWILKELKDAMTDQAIDIAQRTIKALEEQLPKVSDPLIKQKIYNLMAKQVETISLAKVSENFAFKIIDRPRVPDKKYKPKRSLIVVVSFVSSLFLAIFLAFFLEYLEKAKEKRKQEP